MMLLDTNVLVHAVYRRSSLYPFAATLLDRGLRERGLFCISPQNLVEFAAVVSRSRLIEIPLPGPEIARITDRLYRSRRLQKIYPSRGTVSRTLREGVALGISGPIWYDLYLAITMREAGVTALVTENPDDFRRFGFVEPQSITDAVQQA